MEKHIYTFLINSMTLLIFVQPESVSHMYTYLVKDIGIKFQKIIIT